MTEEEAKKKWCRFARANNNNETAGVNRYRHGPDPECTCLASACMAWRWHGVLSGGKRHTSPEAAYAAQNPDIPPASGGMNEGDIPLGYCGDAGQP